MAWHSGQNALYITSNYTNQLFKVDADSNQLLATLPTGKEPWPVLIDEARKRIYVGNYGDGSVWVYNADTLQLITVLPVGYGITDMALLPARDALAVIVRSSNGVAIVENLQVVTLLTNTGNGPFGIDASPDHNAFFVANRDASSVRVIYHDGAQWRGDGPQLLPGPGMSAVSVFNVVYQPATQKLYAHYTANGGGWFVDIYSVPSDIRQIARIGMLPTGNSGAMDNPLVGGTGIAANRQTGQVFIANNFDNTVTVINSATDAPIGTLLTGTDPFGLTIDDLRNRLFIILRNADRYQKMQLTP